MFTFFKKKRAKNQSFNEGIRKFVKTSNANQQIDIWIDDQILFQVMKCEVFKDRGIEYEPNDFVIVHFFNENKTHTLKAWKKFQDDGQENHDCYYEAPKGMHFYLKNIGSDPERIEQEIIATTNFYELDTSRNLRLEFNIY